jgi:hypothetical protein
MGRTLPSFTQLILNEQNALAKFRRALRKEDQRALDDLFRAARYHVAAAAYASHLLPFETMLLAMLIEEHKRVQHLEVLLERLLMQGYTSSAVEKSSAVENPFSSHLLNPLRSLEE